MKVIFAMKKKKQQININSPWPIQIEIMQYAMGLTIVHTLGCIAFLALLKLL